MALTLNRLKELLNYDAETGIFTRTAGNSNNRWPAGSVAGTVATGGYRAIIIDGCRYQEHRVAYFYVNGAWPEVDIDHINGDRADNRAINLRPANRAENLQNQRTARADNKSGFLGVGWHKQASKWRARLTIDGKQSHLGHFDTPELASAAYLVAKRNIHAFCTV